MRLTRRLRDNLPDRDFGLPRKRRFPEEDKRHDRDAIGRATQAREHGTITARQEAEIKRKARRGLSSPSTPEESPKMRTHRRRKHHRTPPRDSKGRFRRRK